MQESTFWLRDRCVRIQLSIDFTIRRRSGSRSKRKKKIGTTDFRSTQRSGTTRLRDGQIDTVERTRRVITNICFVMKISHNKQGWFDTSNNSTFNNNTTNNSVRTRTGREIKTERVVQRIEFKNNNKHERDGKSKRNEQYNRTRSTTESTTTTTTEGTRNRNKQYNESNSTTTTTTTAAATRWYLQLRK